MTQEIIAANREGQLSEATYESVAAGPNSGAKANPLLRLLASARRHWLMVLLVWVFVGGPGAAAVWLLVNPTYTASGFVKVEPTTAIIFPDVDAQQQGGAFDAFLNTQAQEISGSTVLNTALADADFPKMAPAMTVDSLRQALNVAVVPKTHLLRVDIKLKDRDAAVRTTKAVLRAYEDHAGGAEAKQRKAKRDLLETERARLRKFLDEKRQALREKGRAYAAASETTIDTLRSAIPQSLEEAYRQKYQAQAEMYQYQGQVDRLDAGLGPQANPAEDFSWREQRIENDAVVKSLRDEIDRETLFLMRHEDNTLHRTLKGDLEEKLKQRRAKIAGEVDEELTKRHQQIRQNALNAAQQQYEAARTRYDSFDKLIKEKEGQGKDMGLNGLEIRRLQDDLDGISRDYKIVDETISKMEIESNRFQRISVDTEAEILPDGTDDKRVKLLPVAIFGALGIALGLAFLRDMASGRLYNAEDVEGGVGIPLLGSLPALEDLHRGRISEEDFRESYRVIRATLAAASPTGMVPRTLLVTSAQAAEGKTSLAVSLAASLAETGCRVLVIDGDVQSPRIGRTLRLDPVFSLRHVLLDERKLSEAVSSSPVAGLDVLTAGRNGSSAAGLLDFGRASSLLKGAAGKYDHVVIDSPPVLGSADAPIWAQVVDGVVLSSFAGHSSLRIMRQASTRIMAVGGRILGAVLCNLSVRESFYSYSSYRSSADTDREKSADASSSNPSGRMPCVHLAGRILAATTGNAKSEKQ